jgi:hypothetical protein
MSQRAAEVVLALRLPVEEVDLARGRGFKARLVERLNALHWHRLSGEVDRALDETVSLRCLEGVLFDSQKTLDKVIRLIYLAFYRVSSDSALTA